MKSLINRLKPRKKHSPQAQAQSQAQPAEILPGQTVPGSRKLTDDIYETTPQTDIDFSYGKLKPGQIRLVTIHPGCGELMCSLTVVDIPEDGQASTLPPYDGISYVWGDNTRGHSIKCNYSDTAIVQGTHYNFFTLKSIEYVKVTSNLKALLLRLRDYEEWGTFWIDSICINQEDVEERGQQVQLMRRIYALAKNVLIWLGEEDSETAQAFKCVQSLIDLKDTSFEEAPWQNLMVGDSRDADQVAPFFLPLNLRSVVALHQDQWDAFVELFKRPWFHRVWVFQEVIMASNAIILCGEVALPWDTLYAACRVVESTETYRNDPNRWACLPALNMGRIRQSIIDANKGSDPKLWDIVSMELIFEKLLRETRSAQATDPRDKVYALLSLAHGDTRIMPKPDYSISVREAYLRVANYWFNVKKGNDLTFLNYVQDRNDAHNLPSWVPDWSMPATSALLVNRRLRAAGDSSISAALPSQGTISSSTTACLMVKGVRLLIVKMVEMVPNKSVFAERHHAEMLNLFPDPYPTTDQTYLDVYPIALNPRNSTDLEVPTDHRKGAFWDYVNAASPNDNTVDTPSRHFIQAELDKKLSYSYCVGLKEGYAAGRLLFVSKEGFLGLVPHSVVAGDEICILLGAYTPFVIRKLDGGNYRFIGEAYVYGLMNGEAMDGLEKARVENLIFE